ARPGFTRCGSRRGPASGVEHDCALGCRPGQDAKCQRVAQLAQGHCSRAYAAETAATPIIPGAPEAAIAPGEVPAWLQAAAPPGLDAEDEEIPDWLRDATAPSDPNALPDWLRVATGE